MNTIKHIFYTLIIISVIVSCSSGSIAPPEPVLPVPTEKQLAWHEMELNAFIHFTTNTFTNLEWGNGDEDPSVFNPTNMDAEQWVLVLKECGFKGLILTCKHHDGFCLWPSKYTSHSVAYSPYKNGQGDIVKEVSDACSKHGLKFGIYVSPWDRNHAMYGKPEYINYYRNQLTELFQSYGPVFEMWFDGANGGSGYYGGANETRTIDRETYYDWPTTISMVRKIDSTTLFFSDAGPDIRWCGNEQGHVNKTNWNTISPDTLYAGKSGIGDLLNTGSEDGKSWIPAEVNTSIRPGWFYHPSEDSLVKTPEQLFNIYLESVGRGSTLLLNIPPDKRGMFYENDVKSLKGFKAILDSVFKTNLLPGATISVSSYRNNSDKFKGSNCIDNDKSSYWTTDDQVYTGTLEIKLAKPELAHYLVIQEYISLGQRVKNFKVEVFQNNKWKRVAEGTTIGYKRIVPLEASETNKIRIQVTGSKASPVISNIEVY